MLCLDFCGMDLRYVIGIFVVYVCKADDLLDWRAITRLFVIEEMWLVDPNGPFQNQVYVAIQLPCFQDMNLFISLDSWNSR